MSIRLQRGATHGAVAALSLGLCAASAPAFGQDSASSAFTEILVKADPLPPASTPVSPDDPSLPPYSDGGDFLRALPGVDAVRMGGHGLDPVIRGQSQTRLNIIADDAFVHGGCPNRMDPPTSAAAVGLADEVVVERGYQTVLHAAGGPGGTVRLKNTPPTARENGFSGDAEAGYVGNGNQRDAQIDLTGRVDSGYVRAQGHWKSGDDYEDGSGNDIRSAFTEYGGRLELGWTPTADSLISLGYERQEVEDATFAGAGMDAPETQVDTFRLKVEHRFQDTGALREVEASAYVSLVDHVMDNYSLRQPPLSMGVASYREAVSESDTWGGRIALTADAGSVPVTFGLDTQTNTRDAVRNGSQGIASLDRVQSVLWPDLSTRTIGIFAEGTIPVSQEARLVLGARYDHVSADWGSADRLPTLPTMGMTRSPNMLYSAYYGTTAQDVSENNIGGLARWEVDLTDSLTAHASLARVVRTADATERGIASDMGANSWVGDPNIKPEKHHQAQVGLAASGTGWTMDATAWYDRVDDFILRDRARGQAGILRADGATIYRNIDAVLAGAEVSGRWQMVPEWALTGSVAYTYGENLTDSDRALPQIPPLQGSLGLEYQPGDLMLGGVVRASASQHRIDTASGLDTEKTSGWGVLDLYGSYAVTDAVAVRFGVDNVFDTTYASHLAKTNALDPEVVRVNEPGRAFWLRGSVSF